MEEFYNEPVVRSYSSDIKDKTWANVFINVNILYTMQEKVDRNQSEFSVIMLTYFVRPFFTNGHSGW